MSERLIRPDRAAGSLSAQMFASDVEAALERLGVKPGEPFFITPLGGRARARRSDPGTSHIAATNLGDLRQSQQDVLAVFERCGPMTDEQLIACMNGAEVARQSPSGIRSRRAELVRLGCLVDTGVKRELASGNEGIVWGPVPRPSIQAASGALF